MNARLAGSALAQELVVVATGTGSFIDSARVTPVGGMTRVREGSLRT